MTTLSLILTMFLTVTFLAFQVSESRDIQVRVPECSKCFRSTVRSVNDCCRQHGYKIGGCNGNEAFCIRPENFIEVIKRLETSMLDMKNKYENKLKNAEDTLNKLKQDHQEYVNSKEQMETESKSLLEGLMSKTTI